MVQGKVRASFAKAKATAADKMLLRQALPFMALSKNVYNSSSTEAPEGWQIVAVNNQSTRKIEGLYARLFMRMGPDSRPQYAVAFRGTDSITDMKDVSADLDIGFRRLPGQYAQALQFVKDICRERNINPADLTYTGHSLGGYLAVTVGEALNSNNIWSFNAPAPDARTWRRIGFESNKNLLPTTTGNGWVQIRSAGDFISKWGDYNGATTVSLSTWGSPHGLGNLQDAARKILGIALPATQPVIKKRRGLLSSIFNAAANAAIEVSEKFAESRTVNKFIDAYMGVRSQQRQAPVLAA